MTEGSRVDTAELMELLSVSLGVYYGEFTVAAASENLTASQGKALAVLRRGPAPMRALAETMTCDASNITGIVDRLEKRGLVRREAGTSDRRVKNVILTAEGERVADTIRAKMRTTRDGLERLDDEDRHRLRSLLHRVFLDGPAS
ncbi:MarR family winged helix-turn-helix transcriptional regulator [Streptomyces sp. NPDC057854]|uniref:MarR family winged helix-turn-helix transcriptional regulator n=1 Tax=unclassified Streptomyces TaxID=2593676 RepID=UPI0036999C7A